jgi:hypothetical protein
LPRAAQKRRADPNAIDGLTPQLAAVQSALGRHTHTATATSRRTDSERSFWNAGWRPSIADRKARHRTDNRCIDERYTDEKCIKEKYIDAKYIDESRWTNPAALASHGAGCGGDGCCGELRRSVDGSDNQGVGGQIFAGQILGGQILLAGLCEQATLSRFGF